MTLPLERIEGKYEIVAKINEGGMGALYRVRHRLLDEERVVKVLRPQLGDEVDLKQRLYDEARAAIKLRHPNIVQIFDFTVDPDGVGFIVMELIRGVDLRRMIAREGIRASVALALEIARQSLRALGYLHRSGFVHRDIAPDNLMLATDVEGQPLTKMIDLGIAKHLESARQLTQQGTFLGKVRYASPEHFGEKGIHAVDARSDIYAFGIVLYELLTGHHPVPGESPSHIIAGHLFRPPLDFAESDPEGRLDDDLRALLLQALAKEPEARFVDAKAFQQALAALQRRYPCDETVRREAIDWIENAAKAQAERPKIGSTQDRLDAGFVMDPTRPVTGAASGLHAVPPPPDVTEVTSPPVTSPPVPAAEPEIAVEPEVTVEPVADSQPEPEAPAMDDFDTVLAEGCRRSEAGEYAAAVEAFERALEFQPASIPVQLMLAEARGHLDRGDEIQSAVAEIESLVAEGSRVAADRALFQALEQFGDDPMLVTLRRNLREAHRAAVVLEVRELLEAARGHLVQGEASKAHDRVAKARAITPDDDEALHAEISEVADTL